MAKNTKIKICLVCSPGGHLFKAFRLKPWWQNYQRFWVTDPLTKKLAFPSNEKVYYGNFPVCRHPLNFVKNLILAIKVLSKEKPNLIFSTGAGIAPPVFYYRQTNGHQAHFYGDLYFLP